MAPRRRSALQPYGLTEATWLPLVRIARAPASMRQKDLAASLSLDNSSVVRLLDNLETAGLIRRQEEASDRRAKAVVLTTRGRAVADQVEAVAHRVRRMRWPACPMPISRRRSGLDVSAAPLRPRCRKSTVT